MTLCPPPAQLERLLANQLSDAEETILNVHLLACAACRTHLEALTTPRAFGLPELGNMETTPQAEVACARFLATFPEAGYPLGERSKGTQPITRQRSGASVMEVAAKLSGAALPAPWPILPGYAILDELGHGGLGVVYRAQHLGLKRPVALEMIRAGVQARPIDLARFRREAEAVGRLEHPNIIQVHDIGECNGQPYICMELVEGCTLEQAIKGAPQSPVAAARLVETLAGAVQAMHAEGIIHRDLKPANVMLQKGSNHGSAETPRRQEESKRAGKKNEDSSPSSSSLLGASASLCFHSVKITDFGLAKDLHEDAKLTASRDVLGTPNYMAPEQAQGQHTQVGPATDIYALGNILYGLLTGRPPSAARRPWTRWCKSPFRNPCRQGGCSRRCRAIWRRFV